jgi:hypothetical protein
MPMTSALFPAVAVVCTPIAPRDMHFAGVDGLGVHQPDDIETPYRDGLADRFGSVVGGLPQPEPRLASVRFISPG